MNAPLLVELQTEELPPKSLRSLSEAFAEAMVAGLAQKNLLGSQAQHRVFATPRRLAVLIDDVRLIAPNRVVREKILPVAIAFDSAGRASAPLIKKLAAVGLADLDPAALERAMDGKTESLFVTRDMPGAALVDVMTPLIGTVIDRLPVAKLMNYQIKVGTPVEETVRFARPAHGLVILHGTEVVRATALGLLSSRTTQGHRFLSTGAIDIASATDYEETLDKAFVVAAFDERRRRIEVSLKQQAGELVVVAPEALLEEVTALVEWPAVYTAGFDAQFLEVPQECLILTMQQNQKYFALTDVNGQMVERFLLVSNLKTDDPHHIVHGNERVLRARLADARFFFDKDKKRSLESRLPDLAAIAYFKKLGTLADRVMRIEILARGVAQAIGADEAMASRAALLAKADLTTDMVGEFPELQGTMGRYYAENDGEPSEVAIAIGEHYRPRFANDSLPSSTLAMCVSMADKLESLGCLFAAGEIPTGERDPYALRRAALGVLRMMIDGGIHLPLRDWLAEAVRLYPGSVDASFKPDKVVDDLELFVYERLRGLLRERGFMNLEIEAVLSTRPKRIDQVVSYLEAVRSFASLPEAQSLAAANKRIANILKKNPATQLTLDPAVLVEIAEQELGSALDGLRPATLAHFERGDYKAMLTQLATLRDPVDRFFADVMVMADDPRLRDNRLALLNELHQMMNRIADLSMLAVQ
jgi:glycyl-tRNA synthetase beta chain